MSAWPCKVTARSTRRISSHVLMRAHKPRPPVNPAVRTFSRSSHRASGVRVMGFTLLEMIVVMVIMGIIGAMVAVFMAKPVASYVDSARRAELSDIADTALRRIVRDLRLALPNSVRVITVGGVTYLEF